MLNTAIDQWSVFLGMIALISGSVIGYRAVREYRLPRTALWFAATGFILAILAINRYR